MPCRASKPQAITQEVIFGGTPVEVAFTSDLISSGATARDRDAFDGPSPVGIKVGGHRITHMLSEQMQDNLAVIAEAKYLGDAEDAHIDDQIDRIKDDRA